MRQKLKRKIILTPVLVLMATAYYLFFLSPVRGVWIGKIPKEPRRIAKQFLKTVADIPYWGYNLKSSKLPMYELEVSDKNLEKLSRQLPADDAVVFDSSEMIPVKAKFKAEGQSYDVKIKYRGTTSRHWSYPKKSIRIKFENPKTFRGMPEINLVVPDSRGYIIEAFNNYRAKKMGLIVPEDNFVNLSINKEAYGVYYSIEGLNQEFLNRNSLPQTDVYGEETWSDDLFKEASAWTKYAELDSKNQSNRDDLAKFLNVLNDPSEQRFKSAIGAVVDLNNFYAWNAEATLAGSFHQDYRHNARIYFDPKLKKFKFIPWQVLGWPLNDRINTTYHSLVSRLLGHKEFLDEQNKVLWNYVNNEQNLRDDLLVYDSLWNKVKGDFFRDTKAIDQNREIERIVADYRNIIENNFKFLRDQYLKNKIVTTIKANNQKQIEISIISTGPTPIKWTGIKFKKNVSTAPIIFDAYLDNNNDGINNAPASYLGRLNYDPSKGSDLIFYRPLEMRSDITTVIDEKSRLTTFSFNATTKRVFIVPQGVVESIDNIKPMLINELTGQEWQ